MKTKNIYFKNHSYVITYLILREFTKIGNVLGWFNIVKNIDIYLKNPMDKKSLKMANQVLKKLKIYINSDDYSSIKHQYLENQGFIEVDENVYSLRPKNNDSK